MTANQLWDAVARLGIQLEASGDKLRFYPQSAVTAELLAQLQDHKMALLTRLREPRGPCPACGIATLSRLWDGPVACPGCTTINPSDVTQSLMSGGAPTGFVDNAVGQQSCEAQSEVSVARCTRCGSRKFRDVDIHNGQSLRRDCAQCGRFLDFPLWYGRKSGAPTEQFAPRRSGNSPGEVPTRLV